MNEGDVSKTTNSCISNSILLSVFVALGLVNLNRMSHSFRINQCFPKTSEGVVDAGVVLGNNRAAGFIA